MTRWAKLVAIALLLGTLAGGYWRFGIATPAGIAPTSFLLAHFGSEMATRETDRILLSVLALGGLTLIPVGAKLFRDWRPRRPAVDENDSD